MIGMSILPAWPTSLVGFSDSQDSFQCALQEVCACVERRLTKPVRGKLQANSSPTEIRIRWSWGELGSYLRHKNRRDQNVTSH